MIFIEILKTIIIGLLEGITEWLPISSTGHMILLNEWIHLDVTDAFKEMYLVVIQLGAILAIVVLYFTRLNPFSTTKNKVEKKETWITWSKVIVGVLPAAMIGFALDDWLNEHLYNYVVVAIMLILYGIFFILIERKQKDKTVAVNSIQKITYKTAFLIGVFQVLSLIPGTSRSGATILGGMILGASRTVAAEFSFFLAIPVMFGASVLKLYKFGFHFTSMETTILLVGMLTAFITSIVAIKFLLKYIKNNDFKIFGWYRIILGTIVLIYFIVS